jgi:uncharacterized protein (TIGR00369 family)
MKSPRTEEMEKQILELQEGMQSRRSDTINGIIPFGVLGCSHEEQWLSLSFAMSERMMNRNGILHGGVLCAMFDTACGLLSMYLAQKKFTPTISLSVSFLRPVPSGESLAITARATHTGRTINNLVAEARVESSGRLCATASAAFLSAGLKE